jgi:hypothetical protein
LSQREIPCLSRRSSDRCAQARWASSGIWRNGGLRGPGDVAWLLEHHLQVRLCCRKHRRVPPEGVPGPGCIALAPGATRAPDGPPDGSSERFRNRPSESAVGPDVRTGCSDRMFGPDRVNRAVIAATHAVHGWFLRWLESSREGNTMAATRSAIRRLGISVAIARWALRSRRPG